MTVEYKYILNEAGEPEPCSDLMKWGAFMEDRDACRVAFTDVGAGYVSTVFLGMNHGYSHDQPPLLYETMIFSVPTLDEAQRRYATREQAVAGHAEMVAQAQQALLGKCQTCKKNPGQADHPCPFKSEIHDDDESMCNCCDDCAHECAQDV